MPLAPPVISALNLLYNFRWDKFLTQIEKDLNPTEFYLEVFSLENSGFGNRRQWIMPDLLNRMFNHSIFLTLLSQFNGISRSSFSRNYFPRAIRDCHSYRTFVAD